MYISEEPMQALGEHEVSVSAGLCCSAQHAEFDKVMWKEKRIKFGHKRANCLFPKSQAEQ